MATGKKFPLKDAANMIDKLPVIQRFLLFLSKNVVALMLVLLATSVTANVYLIKEIIRVGANSDAFKNATIDYERRRGEKLEEILHQEVKRETLIKQNSHE
ncbi:hypothetical protein SAMN05428988_3234 [Chitinophaga sp. YR573]|uniref:hypothetical protein n=1 Tax=Chitinophaga sp. YR573 TaxID=1881040 RepID=UPI0008B651DB|nr:hypothetical protein [Chitinophaga sp. YR573]SEW21658.1 hypothetical protein SAMN05428988_3234 [Chitinophaga sp. YR573]